MKKSILVYFGVALAAVLTLILLRPDNNSGDNPENNIFNFDKVVTLMGDHPSPQLTQKYFDLFTDKDSTEYFTCINRDRSGIDVQPLAGGKHFTITPDSFYGPDSIKVSFYLLYSYKIVSWDSIFLFDKSGRKVFMSDKEGNISTYWTATDTICNSPYFQFRGYSNAPVAFKDDALYSCFLPFFDTQREVFSCDAVAKIALPPGGGRIPIDRLFGPYPNIYTQPNKTYGAIGYLSSFTMTTTGARPSFVISFPKDHNLYRIDEYGTADPIPAQSASINKFRPFSGDIMNQMDNLRYESEEPRYWKVMYDPYRHYYYRVALHKQEFSDGVANREMYEKPWSIMVFDEKLRKLGEQNFKAKQFFPKDIFVGKEGLYISNAKVRKEGVPEHKLSFSLFKVKPLSL